MNKIKVYLRIAGETWTIFAFDMIYKFNHCISNGENNPSNETFTPMLFYF